MSFWRKILAIISSAAIVLLAYNYFSNRHYHILPDGEVIAHSHPHQAPEKSGSFPGSAHHHTKKQFNLLDYTSVLAFFAILLTGLVFINNLITKGKEMIMLLNYKFYFPCYFHMRAPPDNS